MLAMSISPPPLMHTRPLIVVWRSGGARWSRSQRIGMHAEYPPHSYTRVTAWMAVAVAVARGNGDQQDRRVFHPPCRGFYPISRGCVTCVKEEVQGLVAQICSSGRAHRRVDLNQITPF